MGSRTSPHSLPPEVWAQIAPHLPLYIRSSTLLSLALTSIGIYNSTLPLLYHDLVLGDNHAIQAALRELGRQPEKGKLVRRLYFWSRRSSPTARSARSEENVTNVKIATRLGRLIRKFSQVCTPAPKGDPYPTDPCIYLQSTFKSLVERLPLLQHLECRIRDWPHCCKNNEQTVWIPPSFWTDLRKSCPQCHTISLVHDHGLLQPIALVEPQMRHLTAFSTCIRS
ncbi:hypothetical protein BKA70DRAFT_114029 [Coprinopsis sp. MPI-PUGE-AT-0042]|nr:hypothetical protein BKA70DRAFT_114029 [Coprinopsis sp. MPI-PUGE-AT-0042]